MIAFIFELRKKYSLEAKKKKDKKARPSQFLRNTLPKHSHPAINDTGVAPVPNSFVKSYSVAASSWMTQT